CRAPRAAPLALHDALPISRLRRGGPSVWGVWGAPRVEGRHGFAGATRAFGGFGGPFEAPHVLSLRAAAGNAAGRGLGDRARELRSEEHTSELQSLRHLVCR